MSDVTMFVRRIFKTAFYNNVRIQVEIVGDGDARKVGGSIIARRLDQDGTARNVSSLGNGIDTLVGLYAALKTILKHLEKCGIEIPWLGDLEFDGNRRDVKE